MKHYRHNSRLKPAEAGDAKFLILGLFAAAGIVIGAHNAETASNPQPGKTIPASTEQALSLINEDSRELHQHRSQKFNAEMGNFLTFNKLKAAATQDRIIILQGMIDYREELKREHCASLPRSLHPMLCR